MFRDRKDELLNLNSKYLQRVLAESNITYVEGETRSQVELLDVLVVPFVKMLSPASSDRNRADSIHIDSRQRIQPSSLRDGTSFSENPISSTPESQSTFPLLFALKENKYINLLGEPGSGKSTALKFVAISLIRGASGFSTETDDGTIPILLSLREYSETIQQKGLRESLVDQVMRVGFFNRGEADLYFEFLWNNRRIILLLDGLDEIHELVRPEVIKEIYRFVNATKHKGFPVIVTSRLSGYENLGENFAEYLISSLNDPKQLHKFISRWLSAIKGFDKNNGKDLKQETLGIISDLSLNNGVSGITNNPLHLQMIISTYSRTGEVLPKRTDLYQDYCEKIAWERGISRTPPPESRANCIEALEIIAWSILAKSKTVTQDISVSIQSEVEDVSNVDALLTFLIDGMGLISKYTDGRKEKLFFIRQNFMEYFAAVRLSKIHKKDPKLTWKFIKPRLHSQAWREPILLFTNMLDLESATRFVTKIWKAKSSYEKHLYRDLLLAGDCLGSGTLSKTKIRFKILQELIRVYIKNILNSQNENPSYYRELLHPIERILQSTDAKDKEFVSNNLFTYIFGDIQDEPFIKRQITYLKSKFRSLEEIKPYVSYTFLNKFKKKINFDDDEIYHELMGSHYRLTLKEFIAEIGSVPQNIRGHINWSKLTERQAAIVALGTLNINTNAAINLLMKILKLRGFYTFGFAFVTLTKIIPADPKIIINMLYEVPEYIKGNKHTADLWGTRNEYTNIIDAIGIVGQKYPEIIETFYEILSYHKRIDEGLIFYILGWVFNKCAEVDTRSMVFVLSEWKKYRDLLGNDKWEHLERSLMDGRKKITNVSPQVLNFMFEALKSGSGDHYTLFLLNQVVRAGRSLSVNCKEVNRDGTVNYIGINVEEQLFDLFENELISGVPLISILNTIVYLGLYDSSLMVKLLNQISDSDPFLLASHIKRIEWNPDYQQRVNKSLLKLESTDKDERVNEFNYWIRLLNDTDDWLLNKIPQFVLKDKINLLGQVFHLAFNLLWSIVDTNWSDQKIENIDPFTFVALARYKGWHVSHFYSNNGSDSFEDIQVFITSTTNRSIEIIETRDASAIDNIVTIFNGEDIIPFPNHFNVEIDKKSSRPDFMEIISSSYVLAKLSNDYPLIPDLLIRRLNPKLLGNSGDFEAGEISEHIVHAMGYVRRANPDFINTLIDITIKHNHIVYHAGSNSIANLEDLEPDSKDILIRRFGELDSQSGQVAVLKALGKDSELDAFSKQLYLNSLEGSNRLKSITAARALGDLRNADLDVITALMANSNRISEAIEAVGKLLNSNSINRLGTGSRNLIRKYSKKLDKLMKNPPYSQYKNGKDIIFSTLNRIANQMDDLRADFSNDSKHIIKIEHLLSSKRQNLNRFKVALGIIVASINSLLANIIASYFQEQYQLINDPIRFIVVILIFSVSLLIVIRLEVNTIKTREY